jgi:glycosyltransferase involved in cell wall biosynthesis
LPANLVAAWHRALRLDKRCIDHFAHHVLLMEKVFQVASDFDIIHWHIDYFHFPLSRRHPYPQLTTLHGDLVPLYKEFTEMPVVSISDAQRTPLPWANWQATVYHGYPIDTYRFAESPGEYLAFLGRICPEKRVDTAIAIAKEVGMPLKIAAKVDKVDEVYFADQIKPLLDHPSVDYVGEIGEGEKSDFLGGAAALLFPIDWPEPFGLVMIEAMACGTPVIARNRGSVPEVLEQGVTGFICDGVEDSVLAVKRLDTLSRKRCREVFESRFTVTRMAEDYMKLYEEAISDRKQR